MSEREPEQQTALKRKRTEQTDPPQRISEKHVPLFKAYRKIAVQLAKAEHHQKKLTQFKAEDRYPKAFKVNIRPLVSNVTPNFLIKWERAQSALSQQLLEITLDHWSTEIIRLQSEEKRLKEQFEEASSEQKEIIFSIVQDQVTATLNELKEWKKKEKGLEDSKDTHSQKTQQ